MVRYSGRLRNCPIKSLQGRARSRYLARRILAETYKRIGREIVAEEEDTEEDRKRQAETLELRRFATHIGGRLVLPIPCQSDIDRRNGITVITTSGSEHVIRTLDASSTFRDVYVEIRTALRLPLCQTSISLYVSILEPGKNCSLGENAELPCSSRRGALRELKGSILHVVAHR